MIVGGSTSWFGKRYERLKVVLQVGRKIEYIFNNALIAGGRILNQVLDECVVVKSGGCEVLVFIFVVVVVLIDMLIQELVVQ
jgi:hypothetical protein